jgi:hypothetical protein
MSTALVGAAALGLAAAGCEGSAASRGPNATTGGSSLGSGGAVAVGGAGGGVSVAVEVAMPLSRLTNIEYDNTVRDLLRLDPAQMASAPSAGFPPDGIVEKYTVGDTVSPLEVERAENAAERLAATALEHLDRIVSCDPLIVGEEACAKTFISEFGRRAYRRTLTDPEQAELLAQFQRGLQNGEGFAGGIGLVVHTALLSSYFLFHVPSLTDQPSGSVVDVVDWEMASRLSYFIWGTMPDDELLAAAEAGTLRSVDDIQAQASRMLEDARAKDAVKSFLEQTFEPSKVAAVNRDPVVYPEFNAGVANALADSYRAFLDGAYAAGTFDAFFRSPKLYVNAELAGLYGISGVTGTSLVGVDAPESERLGILTQPGFLTLKGKFDRSDPIHRGVYIVKNLLCRALPDPPPNALSQMPDPTLPQDTTRQQVIAKTAAAACTGCHGLINPLGFGLESFDAIGRFRTREATSAGPLPVDASGSTAFDGAAEPTSWSTPIELANALATSREARRCFAQNMYRFAHRRPASAADDAEIDAITSDFIAQGERISALVLRVVKSSAFSKRRVP